MALVEVGSFGGEAGAFAALGPRDPAEFIQHMAEWAQGFERLHPGLSLRVLGEVTRIVAWVRPSWAEMADRLRRDGGA